MAKRQLAAQLYTVRDYVSKDFAGTLKQVAKIGYAGVELAGFGNAANTQEAAAALKATGLKVCGAHIGIHEFQSNLKGVMETYSTVGCQNLVVPWLPEELRKDVKGWKAFAKLLNKFGKQVAKEGFKLGYHNHSFEFAIIPGSKKQLGMDILIEETDPAAVSFELDCFWVVHGGQSPAAFITKHAKRIMTLHLKDMSDPFERKFANVGAGLLDMPGIVAAGTKARVPWFVVEQDSSYDQDPMDALKVGYKNLKQMKLF
jgi:sugar phosphate isomerase/epimerase